MKFKHVLLITGIAILPFLSARAQEEKPIAVQSLVGYYNVGVKPNKPFFKSRWYLKDNELYTIYDSDQDRLLKLFEDGKLSHNIFLSEKDVPEARDDTTYYLILTIENEQLMSFKVLRPRKDWPTDLYGYRDQKLDHLAVDTESMLNEEIHTDHFFIQYSLQDSSVVKGIAQTLESNYYPLIADFGLEQLPKTTIRIYPDKPTYNNAVLSPNAPLWQMGRVWDANEIRMLSPVTAQKLTGETMQINEIVLHEFVHSLHLNLIKDGTRVPGWFWEGLALYKGCCKWIDNPMKLEYMKNGKYPSLKKISNDQAIGLKYDLGYFLIEYIVIKWGWDTVMKLLDRNGNIKAVLGILEKAFEKEFYSDLEKRYK